ncbi:MAG: hypothetical protein K6B46_04345 [Opitutales bacterium]|nr:hypothetical protein [Opitutales bacterium]
MFWLFGNGACGNDGNINLTQRHRVTETRRGNEIFVFWWAWQTLKNLFVFVLKAKSRVPVPADFTGTRFFGRECCVSCVLFISSALVMLKRHN